MADSEVRQKLLTEAINQELADLRQKWNAAEERARKAYAAGMRAGEIAMREKAAQRVEKNSCVRHCELCKTSPCGEQAAIMIRALAISGAEESKK